MAEGEETGVIGGSRGAEGVVQEGGNEGGGMPGAVQ